MDNQECLDQAGLWSRSARIMTLACLIVFMAQMATTVYLPSLPVVMTDLAMTRQGAELSISLFVIGAALPVLFWGAAADRYGRRLPSPCHSCCSSASACCWPPPARGRCS